MEYTRQLDGLLSQVKTLLSILNPIEGVTAELFKQGVLTVEDRDDVERIHREQQGRDERAAGRTLVEILEQKRNVQTLRGLIEAQDAFLCLYEQVQDSSKEFAEATDQRILNAFQHGHLTADELKHLLETCCDDCNIREIKNFEGKSLLHLACCSMLINTVILLIEQYHFDPSIKDNDGNTPLHDACRCRKVEIVNYLLQLPTCVPNIQNDDGNTALHESIFLKHWGVCRALVASEMVDCTIQNNGGVSVFEWLDQHPQYSREKAKLIRVLSNRRRLSQRQNKSKKETGLVEKRSYPQDSFSKQKRKGILRVSAVEIDMEPKLLPDIYSDTDAQNPKQSRLSVAFWDACISVAMHTCAFGSSLLVALVIITALIYLLVTTT